MDQRMKPVFLSLVMIFAVALAAVHAQEEETETPAAEESKTVYVTDTLQLRLYSGEKARGDVLATLNSGDALTVLEEQRSFSRVRTADGKEGWVKNFYLIEKKPAIYLLNIMQEQLTERDESIRLLEERLQNTSSAEQPVEPANPGLMLELESKVVKLNQENVMMTNEKEQLRKKLVQAELALQHAKQEMDKDKDITETPGIFKQLPFGIHPYGWLGIALGSGLLLGFMLGYRYYSNKLKKRFYGFRI